MTVIQRGTDSSGRPILATAECWEAFDAVCDDLGFVPTVVQGGWLKNAASASADTHAGDAFDVRIWDRTAAQRQAMLHAFRLHAFAYWERTAAQGFDPHAHMVPGPWASPSAMALDQWRDYLAGRNGLASHAPDDGWRPDPLVTTPPEDDMASYADQLARIEAAQKDTATAVAALAKAEKKRADNQWRREAALAKALKEQGVDVDAILAKVTEP